MNLVRAASRFVFSSNQFVVVDVVQDVLCCRNERLSVVNAVQQRHVAAAAVRRQSLGSDSTATAVTLTLAR